MNSCELTNQKYDSKFRLLYISPQSINTHNRLLQCAHIIQNIIRNSRVSNIVINQIRVALHVGSPTYVSSVSRSQFLSANNAKSEQFGSYYAFTHMLSYICTSQQAIPAVSVVSRYLYHPPKTHFSLFFGNDMKIRVYFPAHFNCVRVCVCVYVCLYHE